MSYLKHKPGSIEEIMANQNQKLNDNAYQDMFKKELDKAGTGIGSMSPKEKKDFFNKIDDKYKAKNEELHPKDVPHLKKMVKDGASDEDIKKMHPRITDYELEKLKESIIDPKGIKEEDAYENDRYIIKNGKATLDNSNTPDKKNHVYADGHKDAEKKAKAKGIKETHTGQTKKANNHQRSANGEKEVIKSGAKLKFKEAYKKVKENQKTVDDSISDNANQEVSGEEDKKNDPDMKKPKKVADTGSKATSIDTSPEVEYKN
jgi:hypothetical protein